MEQKQLFTKSEKGGIYFSILVALYCVVVFVGQVIINLIAVKNTFLYNALFYLLPLITLLIMVIIYKSKNPKEKLFFANKSNLLKTMPISLIIVFAMFFGLGFINETVINLFERIGVVAPKNQIVMQNVWQYLYFVLTIAILPAILEELVFRRIITHSFAPLGEVFAILFSGFLFAIYHASISQFAYQFIYGAILALLYLKGKSVLPCILAHFLNNFAVLTFSFFEVSINSHNLAFIISGIFALVISVVALSLIKSEKEEKEHKKLNAFLYSLFGVLVCLALALSVVFM